MQLPLFADAVRPTIRAIADQVQLHGRAGLPDAERRADGAVYQEVLCRSALNRVTGMPFAWTLNPYRGCTHGCHYCFARRYHRHAALDAGDDFSSVIFVKTNFADVLRRELERPAWQRQDILPLVAFGTATDPYQPIEGEYRLSRRTLRVLCDHPTPVNLVTRGPLVLRDRDLLAELSQRTRCTVSVSVPTVDVEAWKLLEPGTAHPRQRLRAVSQLVDAGIDAGVLMAPIVPGISSHPHRIERTVRAIADAGASFVGSAVLHLDPGTREHFLEFLGEAFPQLVERYGQLYAGRQATPGYRARVAGVVAALTARYGLAGRGQSAAISGRAGGEPAARSAGEC